MTTVSTINLINEGNEIRNNLDEQSKTYFFFMKSEKIFLASKKKILRDIKRNTFWLNVVGLSPRLKCITEAHSVSERYLLIQS